MTFGGYRAKEKLVAVSPLRQVGQGRRRASIRPAKRIEKLARAFGKTAH